MLDVAARSRRILVVLSPACIYNKWDSITVYNALKYLASLGPRLSCIALKPLPIQVNEMKNAQGETLSSFLRNIAVIQWGKYQDEKFWLWILLQLPPKRIQQTILPNNTVLNQSNGSQRLNDDCKERLNQIV